MAQPLAIDDGTSPTNIVRGANWIAASDDTGVSPVALDVFGSVTDTGTIELAHASN